MTDDSIAGGEKKAAQDQGAKDDQLGRLTSLLNEANTGDYTLVAARLHKAREMFHELIADRLANPLNEKLSRLPQMTLAEKQNLARWVNSELRSLGVAIRCPKTGQPSLLHADPGYKAEEGRFQISLIAGELDRKKTISARTLFTLSLMGNPDRREPLAEYWSRKLKVPRDSRQR